MPTVDYFAYGSNMQPDTLRQLCPSASPRGPARLPDHRLKFNRKSKRWQAGAADIWPEHGFTVWGVLFSLAEEDFPALDAQEGAGNAYGMHTKTVFAPDGARHEARVYAVIEPTEREVVPCQGYLDAMLEGGRLAGLLEHYTVFLRYLAEEAQRADTEGFRTSLVVRPTRTRMEARGLGLARVHPDHLTTQRDDEIVAVAVHGRAIVAQACADEACPRGYIELDQGLRHALGFPGRESYGFDVDLAPIEGPVPRPRVLQPRTLALPIWPPSWLDSERQIAVLHPHTIRLLGLSEADSIRIRVAIPSSGGGYRLKEITRRVFPGSASEVHRRGEMRPYPDPGELYLDLDARAELEIANAATRPDEVPIPAWISSHVPRVVASRVLVYGVTLFLALAGLYGIIDAFADQRSAALAALVLAVVLTAGVVFVDLRTKLQY
jgi:hypothetical protein